MSEGVKAECLWGGRDPVQVMERLRENLRIAVVYGGDRKAPGAVIFPTRNPRSDKTYEVVAGDIADSLRRLGFRHVSLLPEDMQLGPRLQENGTHLVWLNTGGTQGYVSVCHAPALMELFGMPYVGHNPLNSAILDNKHAFKHALDGLGIATPRYVVWNGLGVAGDPAVCPHFNQVFAGYAGPFIVKPVSGRASQHVHVVDGRQDLHEVVQAVFAATENLVLIEEFVAGREFTVAVAGPVVSRGRVLGRDPEPFAFSPLERVFEADERVFTSMDVRPISRERVRDVSAQAEPALHAEMTRLARRIHQEFNLETMVRVDLRQGLDGTLYVLEANPKPDLKYPDGQRISLVTAGLDAHGMDYDDLVLSLLANRVDFLLRHRRMSVAHLCALLDS